MPVLNPHSDSSTNQVMVALVPLWDTAEATRVLAPNGRFTLGSDPTCEIRLTLPGVAARHCHIFCQRGTTVLSPAGNHPVWLNNQKVEIPCPVGVGDIIRLEGAVFRVEQRSRHQVAGAGRPLADRHGTPPAADNATTSLAPVPAARGSVEAGELLKEREQRLDQRSRELDRMSALLAEQQTQLLTRQNQIEVRAAEYELRQQELLSQLQASQQETTRFARHEVSMQSLQAEAARRQEELEQRERELEAAAEELEHRKAACATAATEAAELRRTQESALEDARNQIEERQLALLEQERDVLSECNVLRAEEAAHVERLAELAAQLEAQLNQLSERETELNDELQRLATDQDQFEIERAAFERQSAERTQAERVFSAEIAEEQRTVEHQAALISELEEQCARLSDDYEALKLEFEESIEKLECARSEAVAAAESVQEKLDETSAQVEALELALQEKTAQLADHQGTADETSSLQQAMALLQEELKARESDVSALQVQLMAQTAEVERQTARLRDAEQAAKQLEESSTRQAELNAWEHELQERSDELADRVLELKRAGRAARQPDVPQATDEDRADALQRALRDNEELAQERDELVTALDELQQAVVAIRDENAAGTTGGDPETAGELAARLQQKELELQAVNDALTAKAEQVHDLEAALSAARTELDEEREQLDLQIRQMDSLVAFPSQVTEESLLNEIESLRDELAAAESTNAVSADYASTIEQYEKIIRELTAQLEARDEDGLSTDGADPATDEHLRIIADLTDRLEAQDAEIASLKTGTDQPAENAADTEELRILHRELDDRTVVLDNREADLRERQRLVEQSEVEVEGQRRELLEARQQLELARAEIQVALEQPQDVVEPNLDDLLSEASSVDPPEPAPVEEEEPQVRSELAELFGLNASTPSAGIEDSSVLPAVDDYSQEKEAAVSLSFSSASSVLLEAPPEAEAQAEPEGDADGDDVVAKYMEQLLARNREKAGTALPEELSTKPEVKQEEKQEAKPPQARSFIEAYMSGEYGEPAADTSPPSAAPAAQPEKPKVPRQKIDLDALRSDMDSFRQLSTKSVENALASHAKRQERGGITTRKTILAVLSLISLFLVAAGLMDIISLGMPAWISLVATAVSGVELGLKVSSLNRKIRSSTANLVTDQVEDEQVAESPVENSVGPEVVPSSDSPPVAEVEATPANPTAVYDTEHPPASTSAESETPSADESEDDDQYFEL